MIWTVGSQGLGTENSPAAWSTVDTVLIVAQTHLVLSCVGEHMLGLPRFY